MEHNQALVFLSLGVLLATARLFGEVTRQIGLPSVLGEILAGVLLGPSFLGSVSPELWRTLFPTTGPNADILDSMVSIAIALYLLVSGMEVDLLTVVRRGRIALLVSATGIVIPFVIGFLVAGLFPSFIGIGPHGNVTVFALFLGTALSISALPVIAKTLHDLNLYRTDLGMIVMPAAVIQDVIGWCVFAVVLGMMGRSSRFSVIETLGMTLLFAVLMLTVVRRFLHLILPWIQVHWTWPGGIIGVGMAMTLLSAAFTEWIGIHALFGAFFFGIALGDSSHMSEQTRAAFDRFISNFFAPLFFASIGLDLDFRTYFDWRLVLVVIGVATFGKMAGSLIAGKLSGLTRRDAWAIGFAMNSRGAMEIILGIVALKYHVIVEKTFVALVVMAIVTSLMSGPGIKHVLKLKSEKSFIKFLRPRAFCRFEAPLTRESIISQLVSKIAASSKGGLDAAMATKAVLAREALLHTGIGHGVAIPHARIEGIDQPMLAIGISETGIDFDAPDGLPATIIVLLLEPAASNELLLQIFADISRTFSDDGVRRRVMNAGSQTELAAIVKLEQLEKR